jgi:hypothetical protein
LLFGLPFSGILHNCEKGEGETKVSGNLRGYFSFLYRVSPNFRLKRKEAKRKRKKGSEIEKKVFVSLRFAKKRKQFFDAKMKLIRSEKNI